MKGFIQAFGKIRTTTVLMAIAAFCAVMLVVWGIGKWVKKDAADADNRVSAGDTTDVDNPVNSDGWPDNEAEYEEAYYLEGSHECYFPDYFPLEDEASGDDEDFECSSDGFEYQRYKARCFYGKDTDGESVLSKDDDYYWIYRECACYAFDHAGNGVCVIDDPDGCGMHNHWLRFEYTKDFGETWAGVDGFIESTYYPCDVAISGNHVIITAYSDLISNAIVIYSDDMCKTFYWVCIPANLPKYKMNLYCRTYHSKILDVNQSDGSVIFAFLDKEEDYNIYGDEAYIGGSDEKTYLIVKADSTFQHFDVLYADDEYIEKTAWKRDE